MSEPFVAEIRIFAGNFAPRGWAFCNGQLLPVSQNTALFSLVGTTYGGNGSSTFALPNMQGRAPMQPGSGPGLTNRQLGQRGGVETVTLTEAQLPQHNHSLAGVAEFANQRTIDNNYLAVGSDMYTAASNLNSMAPQTVADTGGSQPHNNMQPFLTMNFIIALVGLFPSRS